MRGLAARRHLTRARTAMSGLAASVGEGQRVPPQRFAAIRADAGAARRLTSDPVWRAAAHVPYLGRTFRTAGGLAAAADDLAATLPDVERATEALSLRDLRPSGDRIAVASLERAAAPLARVRDAVVRAGDRVRRLPAHGVLGPVRDARADLLGRLDALRGQLTSASTAVSVAPAMLGGDGPRRYFVAFLNNAEMRGSGGLLGAYGILEADGGRVRLRELGTNAALKNTAAPAVAMDAEFVARYRRFAADSYWVNANMSPHFPDASTIWTALWARTHRGERLDGTIAIDPVGLAAILRVTGPATLPDGGRVTGDDVVALTEREAYVRFAADNAARDRYLQDVARAAYGRVVSGSGDTVALVHALARVAGGRHLQVASSHPAEAAALAPTPLAGVLPQGGPFLEVVTQNGGGNKLDYYLRRTVTYSPGRVEVRLRNTAPPGLPSYVGGRAGRLHSYVSVYTSAGSGLLGATLDGAAFAMESEVERGHPVFSAFVDVDAGHEVVLVLRLSSRGGAAPVFVQQPVVVPDVLVR